MCIIVDANVAARVLTVEDDADFKHIHESLFATRGTLNVKMFYGGKLTSEYSRLGNVLRRILVQLDRAGKAQRIGDAVIEEETRKVTNLQLCKSNDEHIIALARVSTARLLCSHDENLILDFTNSRLISKPRGKVYKNASHRGLIKRLCK